MNRFLTTHENFHGGESGLKVLESKEDVLQRLDRIMLINNITDEASISAVKESLIK